MKTTILENKLKEMSDEQLLTLSNELGKTTVAPDALIRKLLIGTEFESNNPFMGFIAVGQYLQFELANRLRGYISNANNVPLS